ncbi:MAG: type II toxin-antitoxin system death-on-curing family toxin [Phycisphaerales bacterium]
MIRGALNREPRFLSIDEVLTLHESAIDEHGGAYGVRDVGLLESALAMPRQSFGGQYAHEYPFEMAAAYAFHICKNRPFVDGNKRTAFAAMFQFLGLNGWQLRAPQEAAASAMLGIAEGTMDKATAAAWIEHNVAPRPSIELREFFARPDYPTLAAAFGALSAGSSDERFATIREAERAIPSITAANLGAARAEEAGDANAVAVLRQHSMLLTAMFRIAEDMGYEW